jgi:hypothetical protein
MASLALALATAAQDNALRALGQDALIAAISEQRLNLDELGGAMSRLLDSGLNKFARWAKVFGEVARISDLHTRCVIELLSKSFHGDPAKAPRDISSLLEIFIELLSETGEIFDDSAAREYVSNLKAGGKTAKLAKQLLAR